MPRSLTLLAALAFFPLTSCATSHVRAKVSENPLPKIESAAADAWRVYHYPDGSIELVDTWPIHSIFALGYSAHHAWLKYDETDKELVGEFALRSYQLGNLFIPVEIDHSGGFYAWGIKPLMRRQMKRILDWGEVPEDARVITHGHYPAELGPPKE